MYLDEDNVCAGFGEGDGDGLADATGAACDEGGMAFKGEESGHCDFVYVFKFRRLLCL